MRTIVLENKRGFTLIELVIVIVLIGILAATALPKFANLTTQARTAVHYGVGGAFSTAIGIAHAAWEAQGATGTTLTTGGELNGISINANGWPDGGAGVTATSAACVTIWTAVLNNPPQALASGCTASGPAGCYTIFFGGPNCTYVLGANAAYNINYNMSLGMVLIGP